MTKLHKAEGGVFTRCRATVRQGQGVTDCPLEIEGVEVSHVVGLAGIAKAGGGIMRKPLGNGKYRDTYVMGLPDGGYMTSTGLQERIYDRTGKLVPEIERRRQRRREQREGQLPELNAMEQWKVDDEYAALQERVTTGLEQWGTTAGKNFRDEAMTAADAAERKLYTSGSLALLLEVSSRHNVPIELSSGLASVRGDVTDIPEPRAYLIQKSREEKATGRSRDALGHEDRIAEQDEPVEQSSTRSEAPDISADRPKWRTDALESLIAIERANLDVEPNTLLSPELAMGVEQDVFFRKDGRSIGQFRLYRDGRATLGLRIPGAANDTLNISVQKDESFREAVERNFGYRSTYRGSLTFGVEELVRVKFTPNELARIVAVLDHATDEVENYRSFEELLALGDLQWKAPTSKQVEER